MAGASIGIYFRPETGGQQVLVGSVLAKDEEEVIEDPDDYKRSPTPPSPRSSWPPPTTASPGWSTCFWHDRVVSFFVLNTGWGS